MTKKRWIFSLLVGTLLSIAALYLAFRNVPLSELAAYLSSINYWWVIPSMAVVMITFVLRVIRWQIILGSAHRVGFWGAHHPLMIGFMMNCILPGRIGEVARPVILRQQQKVPFSTGLATVAAERLFDLVFLIAIFAVVLASVDIDPRFATEFRGYQLKTEDLQLIARNMVILCVILFSGMLFLAFAKTRAIVTKIIGSLPGIVGSSSPEWREKVQRRLSDPLIRITENLASGFSLIRQPSRLLSCFVLSFLVWSGSAISYYVMAMGAPGIGLSFFELTTVMAIVCFFIALPSVPGFWGLWEAGGVFGLALFGIPAKDAAGFTLANHAVQMIPVILVGLVSAVITGVNILQVSRESRGTE